MSTRKRSVKMVGRTGHGRERLPAELSQVNLNASGIDVGASSHFVAVSQDRSEQPVREFAAYTADLYRLAEWLAECGVRSGDRGHGIHRGVLDTSVRGAGRAGI